MPDHVLVDDVTVLSVRDVYRSPAKGRVVEFFTVDHQYRNVAITDISFRAKQPTHDPYFIPPTNTAADDASATTTDSERPRQGRARVKRIRRRKTA